MKDKKTKKHLYICLFISVLFTINLVKTYMDTGELPIGNTIFTVVVYIATILAAITSVGSRKK
ncbi:hypothetical protein [Lysinibacillus antri]|uniref:Uncharacterized protein n=1 Tax=Lysinibacillus antri TaxID=2498145 RepID=A0A3S0RI22_9BACI|nr:hypothetical protein [Lysinibacillus antri]RUL50333.1 hypothetical protein EK386_14235 [Lysinibacillus antri]